MAAHEATPLPNFFRYESLETYDTGAHREFRILTLLPGSDADPEVYCRITHVPLPEGTDKPATIKYEALSWTWGDPRDKVESIIITDGKRDRGFPVRRNLKNALRRLRYPTEERDLWCDYVCINQSDLRERAAQVKLMFFIYGKASNVCVWLGEHENDSAVAVKFVKEQVNDLSKWNLITEEQSKEKWAALAALMDRPWFSRRWVVQELALAVNATVHCADMVMDWPEFETAVALFDRDAPRLSGFYKGSKDANFDHDFFGDVGQMGATRLVHLKSNLFRLDENLVISEYRSTLLELVSNLWSFEAQDPHDVIYAILSIAKDTHDKVNVAPKLQPANPPIEIDEPESPATVQSETLLQGASLRRALNATNAFRTRLANRTIFNVDYEQDFFLLCKQFLKFVIPTTEHHNLDILLRPWSPYRVRGGERIRLPSWIPTVEGATFKRQDAVHAPGGYQMLRQNCDGLVSQITHGQRSSPYNASRPQKAPSHVWEIFEGPHDFRFHVTGFVVDRIAGIQDASQFGNITDDWLELGGWGKSSDQEPRSPDTLWRTLVGDRGPEGRNTMPYYQKAFERALKDSVQGINTSLLKTRGHPVLTEFLKRVEAIVTNRKLFKSKREKALGLAPKRAQNGDYICIIQGMSVPVILRPMEDDESESSYYTLIGESYLHTMMDGRALDVQEKAREAFEKDLISDTERLQDLQERAGAGPASSPNQTKIKQLQRRVNSGQFEVDLLTTRVFELR